MASKFLNWIITPNGRVAAGYMAGVFSTTIVGFFIAPHSALLEKHQEIVQMYNLGDPVKPTTDMQNTANEVLSVSKLNEAAREIISFFTVYGFELYHAGTTQFSSGAVIGLPKNFAYYHRSEVNTSHLALMGYKAFSWDSPTGQQIIDSFVLSRSAKKFAIAREIASVNTYHVLFNALNAGNSYLIAYLVARNINIRLNLYSRPRSQRIGLYSILGFLGVIAFIIVKDALNTIYQARSDTTAAELGREYVLGGIEYYEKIISRNKALRVALGDKGDSMFTAGGNVNETIRVSQIPLTARLDKLKKKLVAMDLPG